MEPFLINAKRNITHKIFCVLAAKPDYAIETFAERIKDFPFLYQDIRKDEGLRYLLLLTDEIDAKVSVIVDGGKITHTKAIELTSKISQKLEDEHETVIGIQLCKVTTIKANLFGKSEILSDTKPVGPLLITHPAVAVDFVEMSSFEKLYKHGSNISDRVFDNKSEDFIAGYGCFMRFNDERKLLKKKKIDFQVMKIGALYFLVDGKNTVYSPTTIDSPIIERK